MLRKITGVFERQLCGYWCLSFPRATSAPASIKRVNDGLVGVAGFAFVVDDALALEAGRLVGEGAVLVDGVGNARIDAALLEQPRARGPKLEVLAPVAGRGMDEARARVFRDMVAVEQGNDEAIAVRMKRMGAKPSRRAHRLELSPTKFEICQLSPRRRRSRRALCATM